MKSLKHFNFILLTPLISNCLNNPKWTTIKIETSYTEKHERGFTVKNDSLYLIGDKTEQKKVNNTMFSFNIKNKT